MPTDGYENSLEPSFYTMIGGKFGGMQGGDLQGPLI
jgi:hypothetical protein